MTTALAGVVGCCCGPSDPDDPPNYPPPVPCGNVVKVGCPTAISVIGASLYGVTPKDWVAAKQSQGGASACGYVPIPNFAFIPNYGSSGFVAGYVFPKTFVPGSPGFLLNGTKIQEYTGSFGGTTYMWITDATLSCGPTKVELFLNGGFYNPANSDTESSWGSSLLLRSSLGCYKGFYAAKPDIVSGVEVGVSVCPYINNLIDLFFATGGSEGSLLPTWCGHAWHTVTANIA